jgi:RNA polymerase sigma-70 factor, ECF subfamily
VPDVDAVDSNTVAELHAENRTAFEVLFRSHYAALFHYALTLLHSRLDAEEIVQDVFLDLWIRRRQIAIRRSLRAYLYGAVRNRCIDVLRHRAVERGPDTDIASFPRELAEGPEAVLEGRELQDAIDQAILELPDRCREVFRLVRTQGLTYSEAGQVLDISVKTVEVQMGRALAHLRRRLFRFMTLPAASIVHGIFTSMP